MRRPSHPVPRRVVVLWAVGLLALAAGIVWLTESLRHPHPIEGVDVIELTEDGGDPRLPVECPLPPPREDEPTEPEVTAVGADPIEVRSNDLYDCPSFYDRRPVRFRGEAVGAVMHRADGVWTQLNDDIYAHAGPLPAHREFRGANAGVGVFLPAGDAAAITTVGGPWTRGDIVEVVGIFHRVDPETREVAVIRALETTIVAEGSEVDRSVLSDRLIAALILVPLAGGALALQRRSQRRSWMTPVA